MFMRRLFPLVLFVLVGLSGSGASPFARKELEYVLLVGGPSMYQWEKYKLQPHDHWWANFVRAARIRSEQIRTQAGPDAKITWLIYKQGYIDRAAQEHQDLIALIDTVRERFNLNLVWFDKGGEVINYLNRGQPRDRVKICDFEYFGHSNKACFMFDYSNHIDSACKSWLHESELARINGRAFARNSEVRSWGCHTGESFSKKWRNAVGNRMWGVIGKTQFMTNELPVISTPGGKWTD